MSIPKIDFMTLTLTFDLLLKKLNLGHNFWTKRDRAFICHMCICCSKTFLLEPNFFYLVTLTLTFDLLLKKLNLDHNFWIKSDRALILHISIPSDKTFLLIPILLTYGPWPWLWPTFGKNGLCCRGSISPVRTDPDLVFTGGKFRENVGKTFHVGVIFTILLLFPS